MSSDAFRETRDRLLARSGYKLRFERHFQTLLDKASVDGKSGVYRASVFDSPFGQVVIVGGIMDNTLGLLKVANEDIEAYTETLKETVNEFKSIADLLQPEIMKQIQEIRSTRMAAVSEMQLLLNSLRDVRKFFLDKDYEQEMSRLERFVRVCKEIQQLKADGTLDAVCDAAIKLAVMEAK